MDAPLASEPDALAGLNTVFQAQACEIQEMADSLTAIWCVVPEDERTNLRRAFVFMASRLAMVVWLCSGTSLRVQRRVQVRGFADKLGSEV